MIRHACRCVFHHPLSQRLPWCDRLPRLAGLQFDPHLSDMSFGLSLVAPLTGNAIKTYLHEGPTQLLFKAHKDQMSGQLVYVSII